MAKVNVYIPDDLLEQVDTDAAALDRSRSSIVQEALSEYVTSRATESRRVDTRRALELAEGVAATWRERDSHPEVSASDYLVGLRQADDTDDDAAIIARILGQSGDA
ncbi:MAG: ribbon-helix-helix protein, CopG family [Coriobacteriia bacterium]